jgi:chitinase
MFAQEKSGMKAVVFGLALGLTAHAEFKVVGYIMGGNGVPAQQYKKLTHVIWSFAYPADNGSISGINATALNNLVTAAHANDVKVFLALGGGGNGDQGWIGATATDAGRRALTKSCMEAVHLYKLDGIDFDWEYPDGASQVAGFNAAVKMLAAELHAEGKQISSAVTYNDWPRSFPNNELFSHFDFLNIMIYDNPAPHSTVAHVNTGIDVWIKGKGLPKEKFIVGCPFYGPGGMYKDIVAANPAAAWVDNNGGEGYNSIPTMKKKTEIGLKQAGGMMFWQLAQDAVGPLSLLSAVNEVVVASGVTGVMTAGPVDKRAGTGMPWNGRGALSFGFPGDNGPAYGRFDPVGRRSHAENPMTDVLMVR